MTTAISPAGAAPRPSVRRSLPHLNTTVIVFLAWAAILVIGGILAAADGGNLFSFGNRSKMLRGMSLLGFVAIGQTFVIICRSLDLSVHFVVAWTSLIAATYIDGQDSRIVPGVVIALAVAGGVGIVNGLVITKLRVNPFIATLGTGLIIKGYLDTTYRAASGDVPRAFRDFGFTRIGFVPISTIVMVVVAIAGTIVLRRTALGYRMFAVGGNDEVARYSGLRTHRTIILAHLLCSLAAAVAGFLIAARFGTGDPGVYRDGYELDSIAAVVLGGTLLMGGRGSIPGTVAGVGILATIDTLFDELGVDPFFKDVLRGSIIVVAVALYARSQIDRTATRQRFTKTGLAR